jgi:hypothetical protein
MSCRSIGRRHAAARCTVGLVVLLVAGAAFSGQVTYTYDSLGRLKTATYSNGVVITYTYDAAGNRSSVATSGA